MKRQNSIFLGVSLLFHGAGLILIGLWGLGQAVIAPESFYFINLIEPPPPDARTRLVLEPPRAGDRRSANFAPKRIEANVTIGSRGNGTPTPQRKWSGEDRKFLRARIFNHLYKDSNNHEKVRAAKEHLSAADSKEPTPFLSSPGTTLKVVEQDQGEILSRIGKDGDDAHPQPRAPRLAPTTKKNITVASSKMIPDRLDMAPANGRGQDQGAGRGSRAGRRGTPAGAPKGRALWLNTRDLRYLDYFQQIYRKVHPLWSFPKHLEVLLEQGDVLIRFTVQANGSVRNVKVIKSSGYQQFDQVVLAAIHKAAPFGPIPGSLGERLDIIAPFEFSNPMIR